MTSSRFTRCSCRKGNHALLGFLLLGACSSSPPAVEPADEAAAAAVPVTAAEVEAVEVPASEPCVDIEDEQPEREELKRELPTKDVAFGAAICRAGREVWRDDADRIRVCTIKKRVKLGTLEYAADAYTHFHDNGQPFQTTVAKPYVLKTAGGMPISCEADFVVLSDKGELQHCKLAKPTLVADVACRAGESIAFHDSGALHGAIIDRKWSAMSATFVEGTRLSWHPDGTLAGGWLREPLEVAGLPLRYDFGVHANAVMAFFELSRAHTIQGHELPEGSKVRLRLDGSMQRSEYVEDSGFMVHGEQWTDTRHTNYDCEGKITGSRTEHWQAPTGSRRKYK